MAPPAPPAAIPRSAGKTNACQTTPWNRTVSGTKTPPVSSRNRTSDVTTTIGRAYTGPTIAPASTRARSEGPARRAAARPARKSTHIAKPVPDRNATETAAGHPARAGHVDRDPMERELVEPAELERGRERARHRRPRSTAGTICATSAVTTNATIPPLITSSEVVLAAAPPSVACASGEAGGAAGFTPRPPAPARPPGSAFGRREHRPPRAPRPSRRPCPWSR